MTMLPILSKDARLPVQLQRAMAAEAEAAREARAKVIMLVMVKDLFPLVSSSCSSHLEEETGLKVVKDRPGLRTKMDYCGYGDDIENENW